MNSPKDLRARAGLLASVLLACTNQSQVVVPNRVLDRPLGVALTCVQLEEDASVSPLDVSACDQSAAPSCTEEGPQLIGYVANSERNEVALFRRCDTTAAIVDLDPNAPGYQLVPAGQLPSDITSTGLGCRVVTANAGSCDMTLLDGLGLAGLALDAAGAEAQAPSSLVSQLVPTRSDGQPLGSRVGAVLAAPSKLSGATLGRVDDPGAEADPSDPPDDETQGDAGGDVDFNQCAPGSDESVWVTFPTCQLVAEVDLAGGQILQSRRFLTAADGSVVVEDGGTAPDCPVDCPIQFPQGAPATCSGGGDDSPECRPAIDANGYFPVALELVEAFDAQMPLPTQVEGLDDQVEYSALFVGGGGSDVLVELQFDREGESSDREEVGRWTDEARTLRLEDPQGINRIRVTPPVEMVASGAGDLQSVFQFIYAISGDGSTHVVSRDFSSANLGVECDTQVDPTTTPPPFPSCNPLDPNDASDGSDVLAPDRRPFAAGPGIRVSGGAGFTDWAFFRQQDEEAPQTSGVPFEAQGVVGVGTTTFGRIVLAAFNQLQEGSQSAGVDPSTIMDLSVPPHSLWPSIDPLGGSDGVVDEEALPLVDDSEPERTLPGDEFSSQMLAPTLRRIDLAYALPPEDEPVSEDRVALAESLGSISNADQLGAFTDEGLYEQEVVRAVVRDYQQWAPVQWLLDWEGTIPGTRSASGRIACDNPGWESGTCVRAPDDPSETARLIDESATFCDNGVLAGDQLVILGCNGDGDCGLGQRCLQEPTAPTSATGICVSAEAYEEDFEVLRQVCAPFITEACGRPRREYRILRAFDRELHLQAIDRPAESHLRAVDPATGQRPDPGVVLESPQVQESVARYTCELPAEEGIVQQAPDGQGCNSDEQCTDLNNPAGAAQSDRVPFVCSSDGFCRGPCPGGDPECLDCDADADCDHFGDGALCVESQCQRPCESGQRDCVQALLPGPRCFAEFVDYVVRTRNSFNVIGDPAPGFITDRVFSDPETGECRERTDISSLLTSRLRLGADEDAVFNDPDFGIPDCPNPDEAAPSDPNPCRITRRRAEDETSRFHRMDYEGEAVSAIRFSNPSASLVIDLADLLSLGSNVDVVDGNGESYTTRFPPEFRRFQRARIPRNYGESFGAGVGYIPISEPAIVGSTVMVFPVQVLPGPTGFHAFIVDAGGRGGPTGVRGQVIRLDVTAVGTSGGFVDLDFLVR